MRLIDADKLIKKFQSDKEYFDKVGDTTFAMATIGVINDIEDAPTIDAPTWIPCSERLPNRQGYYICTCKDGSKYKRTTTVKWSNGWQLTGARAYWVVLAWMPLPKPYEETDHE